MNDQDQTKKNEGFSRRNFLKLSATYGLTAATVTLAGGLWSEEAVAQTSKTEKKLEEAAEFTMNIATPYILGSCQPRKGY